MKYYAIKAGKKTGIFDNWDEAKENVVGYQGAVYKSFSSLEDAQNYLEDVKMDEISGNVAYVDGSYDVKSGAYSFGAVIFVDGKELRFKKKYEPDEFSSHRNVAGEIKGAGFVINWCINHNIKDLKLYYDYEGIHSWYSGLWKANTKIASEYVNFAQSARGKINIEFIKVKSHTNVLYNEIVDKLAKEALGIN